MNKQATTLKEQIELLRSRGVEVNDEKKAKECLLDIGYFRLCSYLFPFEKTYPKYNNRTHEVVEGTRLSDAVALYYFDFDLRNILNRYISRIEVALRTYITYTLSNKYRNNPTWFVDPGVMSSSFINDFETIYKDIRKKPVIKRHHKQHINDMYAPAWKTIEYMTFGNIEILYSNLKSVEDKLDICRHFGVRQTAIFENYIYTVRTLRNTCAHGGVLFDMRMPKSIKNGPAGTLARSNEKTLYGALKVVEFFIGSISQNRLAEMKGKIGEAQNVLYALNEKLEDLLNNTAGLLRYQK